MQQLSSHGSLIIAAMRRIPQEVAAMKAGRWQSTMGVGLRGRTLGVFSYGRIGSVIASYGKAFGMKTLIWGREKSLLKASADGHQAATSKAQFFEQSDVITLQLKLIPQTRGIVTAEDLARMKPTALIVNTSRAGLIEAGALETALKNGRPGMAAVDVYEQEPVLGAAHPSLAMDNALCTPHIGFVERDFFEEIFNGMFDQVNAFAEEKPINIVNQGARQSSILP